MPFFPYHRHHYHLIIVIIIIIIIIFIIIIILLSNFFQHIMIIHVFRLLLVLHCFKLSFISNDFFFMFSVLFIIHFNRLVINNHPCFPWPSRSHSSSSICLCITFMPNSQTLHFHHQLLYESRVTLLFYFHSFIYSFTLLPFHNLSIHLCP